MASMKLALAVLFLVSGLVMMGAVESAKARERCSVVCIQGGHITCDNYPGEKLDGCDCECAPKDGKNCVLHLNSGSTSNCSA